MKMLKLRIVISLWSVSLAFIMSIFAIGIAGLVLPPPEILFICRMATGLCVLTFIFVFINLCFEGDEGQLTLFRDNARNIVQMATLYTLYKKIKTGKMKSITKLRIKASLSFAAAFLTIGIPLCGVTGYYIAGISIRPGLVLAIFWGMPFVGSILSFFSAFSGWRKEDRHTLCCIIEGNDMFSLGLIRLNETEKSSWKQDKQTSTQKKE